MMKETKKIKPTPVAKGIYHVDALYMGKPNYACCYILESNGEAAVIETNTNYAVPRILGALDELHLKKEQVKTVILTHIHLDHAGGAGELMKHLPNAKLAVHPRGRKHMINPEKLIKSVKTVYGEERYKELYGEIIPIPEERVQTLNDRDILTIGSRELEFFDTAGHAKHHVVIWDKATKSLFSGDNFGISYPQLTVGKTRLVFPSTTPTQFEPDRALETYQTIAGLNPERILMAHFGVLENIENGLVQLETWIDFSTNAAAKRYEAGFRDEELARHLTGDLWDRIETEISGARGTRLTQEERDFLHLDIELNGQGLAHYIHKINS